MKCLNVLSYNQDLSVGMSGAWEAMFVRIELAKTCHLLH